MSSMSLDADKSALHHKENSNANTNYSFKNHEVESLAADVAVEADIKPEMNMQNLSIELFENHTSGCIKKYEENWNLLYKKYLDWRNERLNTLAKLQDLKKKVHDDQLAYNKTNIMFKELNVNSRMLKESNNSAVDVLASLGTFLTDAASGITSLAQAFNVDVHNLEFKKILDSDAEITKSFYATRSQCLEQYRDVEEIVRCFHGETFEDSLETLTKSLKLDKLWHKLQNTNKENLIPSTIDTLNRFISKNANLTTVSKIHNSFEKYICDNPAVLDACKSAGNIMYDIYDVWNRDHRQRVGSAAGTSRIANTMIICEEKNKLCQLHSRVNNNEMTQAILESKIEDAIDSLQAELNEMNDLFNVNT